MNDDDLTYDETVRVLTDIAAGDRNVRVMLNGPDCGVVGGFSGRLRRATPGPWLDGVRDLCAHHGADLESTVVYVIASDDGEGGFFTICRAHFMGAAAIATGDDHEFWRGLHILTAKTMINIGVERA